MTASSMVAGYAQSLTTQVKKGLLRATVSCICWCCCLPVGYKI